MPEVTYISVKDECNYDGCSAMPTVIAVGRDYVGKIGHTSVEVYCRKHGDLVLEEGQPEHTAECPNCNCEFGVN